MVAELHLKTEQLKKFRVLAGLNTDTALADRMGIDPGTLSRVLRGKQDPGHKFIAHLVAALPGMDIDDLFEVRTEIAA